MDNTESTDTLEGTRERCIYSLRTFVNEDGFKIEEHTPVDDKDAPPAFYGFYLVNTEIGPIDRYFKFENQKSVADCFDNFRTFAEEDAEALSQSMKKEAEMQEAKKAEMRDAQAEAPIPPLPAAAPTARQEAPDAQVCDENGYPVT